MGVYEPARSYFAGMGEAVADRTINRNIFTDAQRDAIGDKLVINPSDPDFVAWVVPASLSNCPVDIDNSAPFLKGKPDLRRETWVEVAKRVAEGNVSLIDGRFEGNEWAEPLRNLEREKMRAHLAAGTLLMSGRHLQHGDLGQASRPMEVFTNCSTAAFSFLLFYLLLNGSGVGRAYDDAMMLTDWRKMPTVYTAIDDDHPDRFKVNSDGTPVIGPEVHSTEWFQRHFAAGMLAPAGAKITVFRVPDSRGGWAKAFELIERMAFEGRSDEIVILDFSDVREMGAPIKGMQYRPSSGPAPVMAALRKVAAIKFMNYEPWLATMFVDHYASECVLVGGARRAARMATKTWRDKTIFEFIKIKSKHQLWSSNNSVTIDQEFRDAAVKVVGLLTCDAGSDEADKEAHDLQLAGVITELELHAYGVLITLARSSYFDGTGEPGIINQDRLHVNAEGIEDYLDGAFAASRDFAPDAHTFELMRATAEACMGVTYSMITNPCGEIALLLLGGYCVIADTVPFHAKDDDDAEDAIRTAVRALMRTNTMDSLYNREVKRTNRIGVGMTGFHEWAYDRFGFTWKDLVNEKKSKKLWLTMSRFKRAVVDEAISYAAILGVVVPHTNTTFKPAGTTSKLFGLTEGAHLPSMRWYLRWVQFRKDDPLIGKYRAMGYPVKELKTYDNTTIVGFPTAPTICALGDGEWVTTAAEATPEEQYEFLRLLEKYWIVGVEKDGKTPLADTGNQVSYTLKYDPKVVDFDSFIKTLIDGQFSIRCCSVMPQADTTAYEYQPEEPLTKEQYDALVASIATNDDVKEDIGFEHVDCGTAGCPIDFSAAA
jgi:adenosylcobalamin-dependent ribonucleoside-triphosphate reductase